MPSAPHRPNPWIQTPLIESSTLSRAAGCRIHLKLENLQPSGSFKSRGVGNYILAQLLRHQSEHGANAKPTFWISSGGNAGLAAVHAARALGLQCSIVTPTSTKPMLVAKLRAAGADQVVQIGDNWALADAWLKAEVLAKDSTAVYVPPFDHEDIWAGNSTLVDELEEQLSAPPSAIVCSVGGGGLFNGVVQGLDRAGWSNVPVLALETQGADSLNHALKKGEHASLDKITSLATSLGAVRVSAQTYEYAQRPNVKSIVLSDAEAVMGCWRLADDERILVEPACGVNLALCYDGGLEAALGRKLSPDDVVVIVVCGGSCVSLDMIELWRREYGWVEKMMPRHKFVASDSTQKAAV